MVEKKPTLEYGRADKTGPSWLVNVGQIAFALMLMTLAILLMLAAMGYH